MMQGTYMMFEGWGEKDQLAEERKGTKSGSVFVSCVEWNLQVIASGGKVAVSQVIGWFVSLF